MDPDGRDIYNVTVLGVGAKLILGAGISIGFAWDDNNDVAIYFSGNVGVGVEAGIDTPITPSISITKGKNIRDLNSFGGSFHFSAEADFKSGLETNVGLGIIGFIFDNQSSGNVIGVDALTLGGGVNVMSGSLYFNLTEAKDKLSNMGAEAKTTFFDTVKYLKSQMPLDVYNSLMELSYSE
ncbi:MAG: hypothetical protein Ta2D_13930 [Rickettsiales bacterium]|nr:MAG: hypothetical protein Ta2D_13930 [Rickettsiales bacterium]